MRLLLRAALVKEKQPPVELQAAGEEPTGPVGRWFSANLDLRTLLAILGVLCTLVGSYVALQTSTTKLETRLDNQQRQIEENKREQDDRISKLYTRYNAEVVSREEYEDASRHVATRIDGLVAQQQALYTVMLNRALGAGR